MATPKTLLGFFHITFLIGCLDKIDIPIPDGSKDLLYIDGRIVYDDPSHLELHVGQLFTFNSESRSTLRTADALLSDNEGNQMQIAPQGTGYFSYHFKEDDPIKIRPGLSYKISVTLTDGRTFESSFEALHPVPPIEYVQLGVSTEIVENRIGTIQIDTFLNFLVNTELRPDGNAEKSYLKWAFERVAKVTDNPPEEYMIPRKVCYVHSHIGVLKTRVYAGPRNSIDRLNDYLVLKNFVGRYYGEGQYFTLWQESLSEGAFDYWNEVRTVSEEVGDVFGALPGKVKSNFTNLSDSQDEVFGYFYLTQRDSLRFYIDPKAIFGDRSAAECPHPVILPPFGPCPDQLCCNCLELQNSDTIKPDYWID